MLGKEKYSENHELETIIGPSVKVKGNFNGQGNVRIEGSINGTLNTKGDIKIGDKANIQANLRAKNVFVSGKVKGTIKADEKIMLTPTAKVIGDIETKSLAIENGAIFTGKCVMTEEPEKIEKNTKLATSANSKTAKPKK